MPNPLPQADTAVVVRARNGDRSAHAELYALYAPAVFTLARRLLVSRALAEDALQETFVEVLRKIGTCRDEALIGYWIKRIAINKCLMHLRSFWVSRRSQDGEELIPLERAHATPADDALALERALDALPATARVVVWLHDVEGCTHKEIGELMGHSTSFSKSQLARAHERLRVLLEEPGVTVSVEPKHRHFDSTETVTPAPLCEPKTC
jgi:RNA polymerase sigma-70 factor (ECF subfamily)